MLASAVVVHSRDCNNAQAWRVARFINLNSEHSASVPLCHRCMAIPRCFDGRVFGLTGELPRRDLEAVLKLNGAKVFAMRARNSISAIYGRPTCHVVLMEQCVVMQLLSIVLAAAW